MNCHPERSARRFVFRPAFCAEPGTPFRHLLPGWGFLKTIDCEPPFREFQTAETLRSALLNKKEKPGDISPASSIQHKTDYRLILRRIAPASPKKPVPNRIRLLGSGVAVVSVTVRSIPSIEP